VWMCKGLVGAVLPSPTCCERAKLPPVAILPSSGEAQDAIASCSLGADSYVRKPVDFERFIEAAGQVGLQRLILNGPRQGGEWH